MPPFRDKPKSPKLPLGTSVSVSPVPATRTRRLTVLGFTLVILLAGAVWVNAESFLRWQYSRWSPDQLLSASLRKPEDRVLAHATVARLLEAGRAEDAQKVILSLAERDPSDVTSSLLAARALWRSGEPDRAGPYFDRILKAAPANAEVRYWAAEFLYFRGYAEAAEELLKEVIELDPKRGAAWLRLGEIALNDEHYAEALRQLDRAEKLAPSGEVARVRARALKNLGRVPEAEAAARAAVLREPTTTSYAELGELLQFIGGEEKLREAQTFFLRSLDQDPTAVDTMKLLGINYRMLGDHRAAIRILRRALRAAPAMSEGYLLLGQSYQSLGDVQRARRCLLIYDRLEPLETRVNAALYAANISRGSLPHQIRLVRAYLQAGRQDLARETLERVRRKHPEDPAIARLLREAEGPPTLHIEPLPADPEHDSL